MNLFKLILTFFFAFTFSNCSIAQEGFQISIGGSGGVGVVAPQNHYDNPYYELDYKLKLSYGAHGKVGYGFNELFATNILVGYQQFQNGYKGNFDPGLGAPSQSHQKDVKLSYLQLGVLAKITSSFNDDYVYDKKAQLVVSTGFVFSKLLSADVKYVANDKEIAYPSKLIPYSDLNYPYQPISDDKKLFTPWNLKFLLNLGVDVFITESLALNASIQGQASILDINSKSYRVHDEYKASRILYGGLQLEMTYYFNR